MPASAAVDAAARMVAWIDSHTRTIRRIACVRWVSPETRAMFVAAAARQKQTNKPARIQNDAAREPRAGATKFQIYRRVHTRFGTNNSISADVCVAFINGRMRLRYDSHRRRHVCNCVACE